MYNFNNVNYCIPIGNDPNLIYTDCAYTVYFCLFVPIFLYLYYLFIEGLSEQEFKDLCKPYTRRKNQKEIGSGLGLNICVAILKEHGFAVSAQKLDQGTMIKVDIKNGND